MITIAMGPWRHLLSATLAAPRCPGMAGDPEADHVAELAHRSTNQFSTSLICNQDEETDRRS